jgi:2-keto-3-deoxy-galactonokinase
VRQIAPALSLLRQEIARGPDQAPPSLLLFSIRLGELEAAVAAPAEAARLMGQIEGCVLERAADGERYPEAVQMICLQSAKTLTGRFTQLGPRYERLRGAAPSGAGALLD